MFKEGSRMVNYEINLRGSCSRSYRQYRNHSFRPNRASQCGKCKLLIDFSSNFAFTIQKKSKISKILSLRFKIIYSILIGSLPRRSNCVCQFATMRQPSSRFFVSLQTFRIKLNKLFL